MVQAEFGDAGIKIEDKLGNRKIESPNPEARAESEDRGKGFKGGERDEGNKAEDEGRRRVKGESVVAKGAVGVGSKVGGAHASHGKVADVLGEEDERTFGLSLSFLVNLGIEGEFPTKICLSDLGYKVDGPEAEGSGPWCTTTPWRPCKPSPGSVMSLCAKGP